MGNVYVTGYTLGGIDGNSNLGADDIYFLKYGPDGVKQWTKQIGTPQQDIGRAVAVDSANNIFLAGYTSGALDGNPDAGGADAVLMSFYPDGGKRWTRQLGTSNDDRFTAVAVDSAGGIVAAGYSTGVWAGDAGFGLDDTIVAKFDTDGGLHWTRQFGSADSDTTHSANIDSVGNIYVLGRIDAGQPFVIKLDADGGWRWTVQFGTDAGAWGQAIATDPAGFVYVVGQTAGAFSGYNNGGGDDGFIAKFDADGGLLWVKQFGTPTGDYLSGIAIDSLGGVFVVGRSDGMFNGESNAGGEDAVIMKLDQNGTVRWTHLTGTTEAENGQRVAIGAGGRVFIHGHTKGAMAPGFDGGTSDGFIASSDSCGNP
jgi:hypothetical protein